MDEGHTEAERAGEFIDTGTAAAGAADARLKGTAILRPRHGGKF
jgi:hypothetical protein